jgi:hypothetical protein
MLTPEAMLGLAAELTDAAADGDAESLAALAWRLYGEAGEDLAEIAQLRAALHAAWNRPQETVSPAPAAASAAPPAQAPPPAAEPCCGSEQNPAATANRPSSRRGSSGGHHASPDVPG